MSSKKGENVTVKELEQEIAEKFKNGTLISELSESYGKSVQEISTIIFKAKGGGAKRKTNNGALSNKSLWYKYYGVYVLEGKTLEEVTSASKSTETEILECLSNLVNVPCIPQFIIDSTVSRLMKDRSIDRTTAYKMLNLSEPRTFAERVRSAIR